MVRSACTSILFFGEGFKYVQIPIIIINEVLQPKRSSRLAVHRSCCRGHLSGKGEVLVWGDRVFCMGFYDWPERIMGEHKVNYKQSFADEGKIE